MEVQFTDVARRQLEDIYEFIAEDQPKNAARLIHRVLRRTESLQQFHLRGRAVPEYGDPAVREVHESSYRIIYRVTESSVSILAVMHSMRAMNRDLLKHDEA